MRLEAPARPAVEGALEVVGHHLDELLAGEFRWRGHLRIPTREGAERYSEGLGQVSPQASNRLAVAVLLARGARLDRVDAERQPGREHGGGEPDQRIEGEQRAERRQRDRRHDRAREAVVEGGEARDAASSEPSVRPNTTMISVSPRTIARTCRLLAPTRRSSANSRDRSEVAITVALTSASAQKMPITASST